LQVGVSIPKTRFDRRFIADMHFIQWLSKLKKADSRKYYDATKQLVRIKASSAEYKKEHNVMLSV